MKGWRLVITRDPFLIILSRRVHAHSHVVHVHVHVLFFAPEKSLEAIMEDISVNCVGTVALRNATYELTVRATTNQLHLRLEDRADHFVWTGTFNARCECKTLASPCTNPAKHCG